MTTHDTIVDRKEFAAALRRVTKALAGKTNLPILECVHLVVNGNALTLQATNLSVALWERLEIDSSATWAALIPGTRLADVVGSATGDITHLSYDDQTQRLTVKSGASRVTLAGLDPADFPALPEPGDGTLVGMVDAVAFGRIIETASYAALPPANASKPILQAIRIDATETVVSAIAADGFQLSMAETTLTDGPLMPAVFLPPAVTMQVVANALSGTTGLVDLRVARNNGVLLINTPNTSASVRLMDGDYPNVAQLIPAVASGNVATVKRADLLSATSHLISLKGKGATINAASTVSLTSQPDGLHMKITNSEVGDGETTIDMLDGAVECKVNIEYLRDAVAHVAGERISLIVTPQSACIIRPVDGDSPTTHLLMCVV